MDLKFKGKVAIITGAGSQIGYGQGIAKFMAKEGCTIFGVDHYQWEGCQQTAQDIIAAGGKAAAFKADCGKKEQAAAAAKECIAKFGQIDILINNAGASTAFKPFLETTEEEWNKDMNDNLYAHMMMVKAVAPYMIERKYGRIVCYSGGQGLANNAMYGASKAGVVAFAHSIAKELAPHGIIVNIMMPGVGNTGLGGSMKKLPSPFLTSIANRTMLKRLCEPEDMAPAVAFLASDVCSYMVGGSLTLSAMG
jgi:NAD(P)-dependent dehydrogenase (short-subunit alcohol dehydrogenase family)